jgi:NADH-quinone oxidoreductase subunit L
MELDILLPRLLGTAWLLPLASFVAIVFFGPRMGKAGKCAGYLATGAIILAFVCSAVAMTAWLWHNPIVAVHHETDHAEHAEAGHGGDDGTAAHAVVEAEPHSSHAGPQPVNGNWYFLCQFGSLSLSIGYYIDALTLAMFCMVTLVASCIHVYSFGYMHEELEDVTDPLVTLADGSKFTRPGRFHRFYQYFSLFCFSMLGLVIAGNVAMVFVFWELVGICSYLLIGFYVERKSASNAANKAFIVNRVGDFGMIIGMMALWSGLGTFEFGDLHREDGSIARGVFSQVRPGDDHVLVVPDNMVRMDAKSQIEEIYRDSSDVAAAEAVVRERLPGWRNAGFGYWLLVVAGLGIFCGCMGKSAQFPLHVWLPDAMEGPTPVSALIHAATMVAAGVYLAGRFCPVFTPEVMMVIAFTGCITLFIAATIAITATDIKRVLAYSTVSQLGYMMFAIGLGGWVAGLFHLFTHAFFKSLLFLCSGSVIHACHTNEMPEMGGLLKKMPWTAWTMLTGCLAISGAGIPLVIGLSGYYSKDSILAQAFSFGQFSPQFGWLFWVAAGGASITAFYMFRLWFMTFVGKPRGDQHIFDHAHESPKSMYIPLVVLAVFAVIAGWNLRMSPHEQPLLANLLEQARPVGTGVETFQGVLAADVKIPAEHLSHENAIHYPVSFIAFGTALTGFLIALLFYGVRILNPEPVRKLCSPLHRFLLNKWFFDELYDLIFIRPTHVLAKVVAGIDRNIIDWIADNSARAVKELSRLDDMIDRTFVDGSINGIASCTHAIGLHLRKFQTGKLRQYVVRISLGTVILFLIILYWSRVSAGN